jgi:hypothetical protein
MFAAVAGKVALPISVDVQTPRHAAVANRFLPDASEYCLAAPLRIAGKAYVERNQSSHWNSYALTIDHSLRLRLANSCEGESQRTIPQWPHF